MRMRESICFCCVGPSEMWGASKGRPKGLIACVRADRKFLEGNRV